MLERKHFISFCLQKVSIREEKESKRLSVRNTFPREGFSIFILTLKRGRLGVPNISLGLCMSRILGKIQLGKILMPEYVFNSKIKT